MYVHTTHLLALGINFVVFFDCYTWEGAYIFSSQNVCWQLLTANSVAFFLLEQQTNFCFRVWNVFPEVKLSTSQDSWLNLQVISSSTSSPMSALFQCPVFTLEWSDGIDWLDLSLWLCHFEGVRWWRRAVISLTGGVVGERKRQEFLFSEAIGLIKGIERLLP